MNIEGFVSMLALVASVGLLFATVVIGLPMVARATLGLHAKRIEYRVLDAVLDGSISPHNPALKPFLHFVHTLTEHPSRRAGLTEAIVIPTTMTYANMDTQGRIVIQEIERDFQRLLTDYNGSKVRFVLAT